MLDAGRSAEMAQQAYQGETGEMNKEEALALWRQGKDAWNAWAKDMLDQRAAMEQAGPWAASRDLLGGDEPGNEATGAWIATAAADFTEHQFDATAEFTTFLFPGKADFGKATFQKDAGFYSATFSGYAGFASATFSGDAFTRDVQRKPRGSCKAASTVTPASPARCFRSKRSSPRRRVNAASRWKEHGLRKYPISFRHILQKRLGSTMCGSCPVRRIPIVRRGIAR